VWTWIKEEEKVWFLDLTPAVWSGVLDLVEICSYLALIAAQNYVTL